MERPVAASGWLVEKTGIAPATFNKAFSRLEELGIVKELTKKKRNRLSRHTDYIEILSRGTENPDR
ncbi:hypothetical protein SAMN02745216_02121 [Desulfatibacillum alkenivorans DSM 16219]|jgi:DNA-binding transcriptional regulator YhcF (GntR family)|uniref:Uncharacterized protein n=1 Tax=Desulfatibacillum alkenivorans DSM 16219 TaxID=1121393 RepID=A0A1M6LFJ3_9BACT|nr:hypothetical protein [Desulfatibacillum alkenivorans]SHJ69918.1 hypothetical protein SAMN02745216_02121 [Desulfatibacillum alkenivorans DSM 16219]